MAGPRFRILRAPWGLSIGDGSYYGWRLWLHIGPLVILAARDSR